MDPPPYGSHRGTIITPVSNSLRKAKQDFWQHQTLLNPLRLIRQCWNIYHRGGILQYFAQSKMSEYRAFHHLLFSAIYLQLDIKIKKSCDRTVVGRWSEDRPGFDPTSIPLPADANGAQCERTRKSDRKGHSSPHTASVVRAGGGKKEEVVVVKEKREKRRTRTRRIW